MTKKKDKNLPQRIWLDEESCWNNQPQYSEGYVEYVREDYHAQAMLYVLQKGVKQGKKEMLDKAIEWLRNETMGLLLQPKENYELVQEFVDCFKEAMEE